MARKALYGRDTSLQLRMALTMLLLTAVYLIFSFVLFRYTHLGFVLIVIPLVGLFVQYYFSDKMVLASAGARVIEPHQAPELYGIVERLAQQARLAHEEQAMQQARDRLTAYEEASTLLEEYVTHVGGQRVLVEYYLALSEKIQQEAPHLLLADGSPSPEESTLRVRTLLEVQQRIEHVCAPHEEE